MGVIFQNVSAQAVSFKVDSVDTKESKSSKTVLTKKNRKEILEKYKPFEIKSKGKTLSFTSYKRSFFEDNSISLQNEDNSPFKFEIIFNENESHGYAYYENAETGYEIKSVDSDSLSIKELPIGEIIFVCSFEEESKNSQDIIEKEVNTPPAFIGNYATESNVYKLESKPQAPNCIYLDFDGENVGQMGWSQYSGSVVTISDAMVKKIWEAVAMDYLTFDVNVTTSLAVFNSYPATKRVMQVYMDYGSPGWLGIAYLNSFGGKPCLVQVGQNPSDFDTYLFRTPSHELGHTMGLKHDGNTAGVDYYGGHGEYVPIMGTGSRVFSLWCKGEYAGANNTEDDISIITSKLGSRLDDNTLTRYISYAANGSILNADNTGIIEKSSDIDEWVFSVTASGNVNITVDPILKFTDLDVELLVEDQNGNQIALINPVGSRSANFNQTLNAGNYKLKIRAGSELTPSTGWSTYAVFGYYEIYGSVEKPKFPDVDLKVMPLTSSVSLCNPTNDYSLALQVQNKGTQNLAAIDLKVYVDGSLTNTFNQNTLLAAGATNNYTLTLALPAGNHSLAVEAVDPQNQELDLSNNTKGFQYNLKVGEKYNFSTNYALYNKNTLTWSIKNTATNVSVSNSDAVKSQVANVVNQEVCLDLNSCFEFSMSGSIKNCNSSYPQWSAGTTYVGGNRVNYNNATYEAKWWTQNPTTSGDWKWIEDCDQGASFFRLYNADYQDTLVKFTNSTYVPVYTQSFCSSVSTSSPVLSSEHVILYPNPAHDQITLQNIEVNQNVKLFNSVGQLIQVFPVNASTYVVDVSGLSEGIYFIQTNNDIVKFIKR